MTSNHVVMSVAVATVLGGIVLGLAALVVCWHLERRKKT